MLLSKTSCITVALCLAALSTSVLSQDDQPKSNSRNNLLLRRGNIGRQNPLSKTTTTTPPPEYAEDEYVDEEGERVEGDDGEDQGPAVRPIITTTTTTTEPPKKIRPSIRPFRSNDDLLSALKKRRLESKNHKPAPPKEKTYDDEDIPAPAPAKSAKAPAIAVPKGRRFGPTRKEPEQNAAPSEQSEETNSDNVGAKSLTSRLGRSRFALKQ
ncbi:uncharacterized protein LOC131425669 isoform X2 [Malaya genurostris]|uniref:uncharacterized protein LOC131425669 isoform X2 n=1 Tax=Malaya genurostris TaxID=325434 RepID=UPI0026F394B8|nr:uncharacterized protein LOC131425669 isoform X2 [Malaya genurostris]